MILSNVGIKHALESGQIEITPTPLENQYTTSAVDLFIGNEFQAWDDRTLQVPGTTVILDVSQQSFPITAGAYLKNLERERDGSVIFPPYRTKMAHILAVTREKVFLKKDSRLAARVEGRSSLARLGLMVHITAPTIHNGFQGNIALEMVNLGPFYLKLVPEKTRICQLIIERLETDAMGEINTGFQGQSRPSGDR